MSLDCIWILPNKQKAPKNILNELDIKRSFFYSNENLAFKGDLYSEWLELTLGYTLCKEEIKYEEIQQINSAIDEYLINNDLKEFKGEENELSIKEIKDFISMWKQMSNLDASLKGWW